MKVSREDKGKLSLPHSRFFLITQCSFLALLFLDGLLCDQTETVARETGASSPALKNFKCVVQYSEGYQIFNPFYEH